MENGSGRKGGKDGAVGTLGALWGLTGVFLLLGGAVFRLAPVGFEIFSAELSGLHWGAIFASLLFMGYFEGYAGFQKSFCPRITFGND